MIPSLASNFIDGKGKGVETTLGWQWIRWWRLEATHTQASARTWAMPIAPAATTALEFFQPPRNRWTVQSSWNIGQRLEFDFTRQNPLTTRIAEGRPEVLSGFSYVKRSFNVKWVRRFWPFPAAALSPAP